MCLWLKITEKPLELEGDPQTQKPKQAHKLVGTNIAVSSSFRAEITRYIEQYVMNCSSQLQTKQALAQLLASFHINLKKGYA